MDLAGMREDCGLRWVSFPPCADRPGSEWLLSLGEVLMLLRVRGRSFWGRHLMNVGTLSATDRGFEAWRRARMSDLASSRMR